jgi:hypothetical protein
MPIPGRSGACELEQSLNSALWELTETVKVQYTADTATTQLVTLEENVITRTFSHAEGILPDDVRMELPERFFSTFPAHKMCSI